ncbi:DNA (cytosine-5)-methyltransferase 1 [Cryobacterium psychrotolerans]|uniref:Cytosine-specific methyltransferase n=2 Tax=Cryobacterium psychrotolerans TaxID=386301 RepID=A0A1G8X5C6_9MICO|nr:DNA (cytosine-5-)-methyltransferase [Cryobacterium psychrotolerans]TFD83024.1 DNA (cytosine-5-)-methyltransferase [Cryobacterium psychrotolerans]SDJ85812.1 DNA (cytosine-5)-methyltransferase 1 [Cryobacterium psychrotolerans]
MESPKYVELTQTSVSATSTFRFVDLFAGLGGFHTALAKLGGSCVFACEWVEGLQDLYQRNYGMRPHGDITTISAVLVPDHEFLAAGFPCQPFSKAGDQLGFEHTEQGRLFFNVLEILEAKRPKNFILENVPNLLKHDEGKTFARMRSELGNLGYTIRAERLSPHQFGVPQIRERLYMVGSLDSMESFAWPTPTDAKTHISTVLDANPPEARAIPDLLLRSLEMWDDFLTSSPASTDLPSFPLWSMEWGADYPYETTTPLEMLAAEGPTALHPFKGSFGVSFDGMTESEILRHLPSHAKRPGAEYPRWKKRFLRQNREFYTENQSWIDPWLPRVAVFPSSLQKFEWNAQGEERTVWKYVLQQRASGIRLKRVQSAPTLVAMTATQVPIIAWERRFMTQRECARLQSLGMIELPSQIGAAYKALGNAVNAHVVELIAQSLLAAGGVRGAQTLAA